MVDWQNNLACTGPDDDLAANKAGQIVNGWTVFQKTTGQVIYVSSSGNDSNAGTNILQPIKTIAKGLSLLRTGSPDWLLLKRGDTFNENLFLGKLSGKSTTEPLVVSSYGDSILRPLVKGAIDVDGASHVALVHIGTSLPTTGNSGSCVIRGADVLVEGCRFDSGAGAGLATAGVGTNGAGTPSKDIRIRRNVFYENMSNVFLYNTNTILFEENVIFPPPVTLNGSDMHGIYVTRDGNSNVTVQNNLFMQDPALNLGDGIKVRPGGIIKGNVVVGAAWTSILSGQCSDSGETVCTGTNGLGVIDGNLIADTPNNNYGIVYDARFLQSPVKVTNNILLRVTSGLVPSGDNSQLVGNISVNSLLSLNTPGASMLWQDNIFYRDNAGALANIYNSLDAAPNFKAANNRFYSTVVGTDQLFALVGGGSFANWKAMTGETGSDAPISFVDVKRSLGSYNASLGGTATTRAFFDAASKQAKFSFDNRYTAASAIAYVREGLAMK